MLQEAASVKDDVTMLPPLYISEFVLEPTELLFAPDGDEFQNSIAEVVRGFQRCVLSVSNLVPDPYFDAFTRYVLIFLVLLEKFTI